MSNTSRYYDLMRKHRAALVSLDKEFEREQKRLDEFRDSLNYEANCEFLKEEKRRRLMGVRQRIGDELEEICDSMERHYLSIAAVPPSEENLRLLTALQMRSKLTGDDLRTAANAMKGDAVSLGVLDELGKKHGVLGGVGLPVNMSSDKVREGIGSLRENGKIFLYGTDRLWGDDERIVPGMSDSDFKRWRLSREGSFTDEATLLHSFGVSDVQGFSEAVNDKTA